MDSDTAEVDVEDEVEVTVDACVVAVMALRTWVTAGWTFEAGAGTSERTVPVMASVIEKVPPTVTSSSPTRVVSWAFPPAAMMALAPVRLAPEVPCATPRLPPALTPISPLPASRLVSRMLPVWAA